MANQLFLDAYGSVQLKELIEKIQLFSQNKLSQEELDKWSSEKVAMRANIGIFEKQAIMFDAQFRMEFSEMGIEYNLLELEKFKFFYVLLGYYTNIVFSTEEEADLCTFKNYDLIMPLVKPWVLKACEFDYKETCSLIDQNFDWHRLKDLMEILDSVNVEKLEELTKKNEKFLAKMQSDEGREYSQELLDIARFNDPITAQVADAMKTKAALNTTMEKSKNKNKSKRAKK